MQLNLPIKVYYKDPWHYCHCEDLGLLSHGATEEEAIENLKEVFSLFLEHTPSKELGELLSSLMASQKPKVSIQTNRATTKAKPQKITSAIWETPQYAAALQEGL